MSNEIKEKIKERYDKIAVFGNSDSCCTPASPSSNCCGGGDSIIDKTDDISLLSSVRSIGYDAKELKSIPVLYIRSGMWKSN